MLDLSLLIHSFPFNLITFRFLSAVLNFIYMVAVHKNSHLKVLFRLEGKHLTTWERKPQESSNSREASSLVKVGRKNCLITGRTIQKQNNHGERRPHLTTHSSGIWTLFTYVAARAEAPLRFMYLYIYKYFKFIFQCLCIRHIFRGCAVILTKTKREAEWWWIMFYISIALSLHLLLSLDVTSLSLSLPSISPLCYPSLS